MTLQEIINIIKEIGSIQPNVNSTTEGSIYEVLNNNPSINYANFHITQNKHQIENENFIIYNFIFFYVDRLTADKSNKVSIQSIGIEVLNNIIRTLRNKFEDIDITNTDFQPFTERFSDNCAGVYSNISIAVPITYTCEETFGVLLSVNTPNKCYIKNQYIEVDITENGRLVVNYDPEIYTGIERVVINTNLPPSNGIFNYLSGYTDTDLYNLNIITSDNIEYTNKLYNEWNINNTNLTYNGDNQLVYAPAVDTSNVINMSYAFSDCGKLTFIPYYNTSKVTNMYYMFHNCPNLTSLDVSNFDTSNVTDMGYMFSGCGSLTSLDVSKFNTSNVTNMLEMFSYCSGLTSLDVSNFNTNKVSNMRRMFSYCSNLQILDVSNFNTSNVTDLREMFSYCSNLQILDVSNFNTSNVTNMSQMFSDCNNLIYINLSGWDTSNVTNMYQMFSDCNNLSSLNLSHFNVSNVTTMRQMFDYCSGLTYLNISNWDMSNIKLDGIYNLFNICKSLETIISDNLKLPNINIGNYMELRSCTNLTVDSLVGLLNALPPTTNEYKFTLGTTNLNKLTDEQKAIATNKGWTLN